MKYELGMKRLTNTVREFIQQRERELTLNILEMDEFRDMSSLEIRNEMERRYMRNESNPYHPTRNWADQWTHLINFNIREISSAIVTAALGLSYRCMPDGLEYFVSLSQLMTMVPDSRSDEFTYSQEDLCTELFDPLFVEATTLLEGIVENPWAIPVVEDKFGMIKITEGEDFRIATYHQLFNDVAWAGTSSTPQEWLAKNENILEDDDLNSEVSNSNT